MPTWKEDIEAALGSLGGEAQLAEIYEVVAKQRPNKATNWHSAVRQILQSYDPDSKGYTRGYESTFYRAGKGRWGLRAKRKSETAVDRLARAKPPK